MIAIMSKARVSCVSFNALCCVTQQIKKRDMSMKNNEAKHFLVVTLGKILA